VGLSILSLTTLMRGTWMDEFIPNFGGDDVQIFMCATALREILFSAHFVRLQNFPNDQISDQGRCEKWTTAISWAIILFPLGDGIGPMDLGENEEDWIGKGWAWTCRKDWR
jgi:hypothetical protein